MFVRRRFLLWMLLSLLRIPCFSISKMETTIADSTSFFSLLCISLSLSSRGISLNRNFSFLPDSVCCVPRGPSPPPPLLLRRLRTFLSCNLFFHFFSPSSSSSAKMHRVHIYLATFFFLHFGLFLHTQPHTFCVNHCFFFSRFFLLLLLHLVLPSSSAPAALMSLYALSIIIAFGVCFDTY